MSMAAILMYKYKDSDEEWSEGETEKHQQQHGKSDDDRQSQSPWFWRKKRVETLNYAVDRYLSWYMMVLSTCNTEKLKMFRNTW